MTTPQSVKIKRFSNFWCIKRSSKRTFSMLHTPLQSLYVCHALYLFTPIKSDKSRDNSFKITRIRVNKENSINIACIRHKRGSIKRHKGIFTCYCLSLVHRSDKVIKLAYKTGPVLLSLFLNRVYFSKPLSCWMVTKIFHFLYSLNSATSISKAFQSEINMS